MTNRIILIITFGLIFHSFAFTEEIPFSLDDRDRLIRVEEGQRAVNQRIDDLRADINSLRELMYVVIGGMFVLVGFVIWDRRTALAPAIGKHKELEEREEKIEKALKDIAKKDPNVAEALKNVGIL